MPDTEIEATLRDAGAAREDHDVVALLGNGAGWYTALVFADVLPVEDAQRLVGVLADTAADLPFDGSQVVFPQTDAAWRPDPRLASALAGAMAVGDGQIHRSVDLGAYAVLTGTPAGVDLLTSALPSISVGEQRYPLVLPARTALHTPLAADLVDRVRALAPELDWRRPTTTLIDGSGVRHSPWSSTASALRDATLSQLVKTVQFATALRVALREFAPDVVIVPGSGGILPAVCGQLIVAEGYRGLRSRRAFVEAQRRRPIVLSMRHPTA